MATTQKRKYTNRELLAWLWREWKGNRLQAGLNVMVGVLVVVFDFLFVWATKLTIDIATGSSHSFTLFHVSFFLIAFILMQIVLSVVSRWIKALLGVKAQNRMQKKMFARLLHCEWQGLERFHSGDIINRIERDVADVIGFLTESVPSLFTVIFQFVGAFVFLFILAPRLAVLVAVLLPVFLLVSKLYMKKMRALTHDARSLDSQIQATLQESIQHRMIIKTLERAALVVGKLDAQQSLLRGKVRRKALYSSYSSLIMNLGFSAGYLITFLWGVSRLQEGLITYGALIAFIQLVGQIQGPVRSITRFVPVFISSFTAAERLIDLCRVREEETDDSPMSFCGAPGIALSGITYRYPSAARDVLTHFSHRFAPGSKTAIIGETGSGKTTLIRLLLALIRPQEGTAVLYNADGQQPIGPATRAFFTYVPQGNTLFSGTIRDNLLMGNPAATEQMMCAMLHLCQADFVDQLPDGIDTSCGESGYGLSEGQAQRICIARALLRGGEIYLFDEATSALDSSTETALVENLIAHYPSKTLIFITHEEELRRFCDDVITLVK